MSNEKVFFQKHRKVCIALCIFAVVQLLLIAGSLPELLEEFKNSFDKALCYKAEEPTKGHPVPWMLAIPVPLLMLAWIWGLWLCVRSFLSLIRHRKDRSAATTVVLGGFCSFSLHLFWGLGLYSRTFLY